MPQARKTDLSELFVDADPSVSQDSAASSRSSPGAIRTRSAALACSIRQENDVEGQAVLAALAALAGRRKANAAHALSELLSRRGLERPCELLVA
jgi:hypothetical protein